MPKCNYGMDHGKGDPKDSYGDDTKKPPLKMSKGKGDPGGLAGKNYTAPAKQKPYMDARDNASDQNASGNSDTYWQSIKNRMSNDAKAGRQNLSVVNKNSPPSMMAKGKGDPNGKVMSKSTAAKKASAGDDMGKPGKNFGKIAAKAGKEYGSASAGKKVAGSIFQKERKAGKL